MFNKLILSLTFCILSTLAVAQFEDENTKEGQEPVIKSQSGESDGMASIIISRSFFPKIDYSGHAVSIKLFYTSKTPGAGVYLGYKFDGYTIDKSFEFRVFSFTAGMVLANTAPVAPYVGIGYQKVTWIDNQYEPFSDPVVEFGLVTHFNVFAIHLGLQRIIREVKDITDTQLEVGVGVYF